MKIYHGEPANGTTDPGPVTVTVDGETYPRRSGLGPASAGDITAPAQAISHLRCLSTQRVIATLPGLIIRASRNV